MRNRVVHADSLRLASRSMLVAVFFLLFAAHVALPCLMATLPGTGARSSALMCQEAKLFSGVVDTNAFFQVPLPAPLALTLAVFIAAHVIVELLPVAVRRRINRPTDFHSRGRPFAGSDPGFLPAFAALRDA